ncbi:D-hexose-6-phosphate mutarotase [Trueperella pecoris]|uniref:Putative glucose-6-phosphate 1-epimerase n=1 Tax=Trueperella pecoris TaxID=2733571 RepID=A0A7M1R0Y2_9ACTO|nr:D-hexose-6-phosphate mutarotase [Trueperella pecoris]QOR47793.1 D-hexose-6-phosphate mutarotase [Trueperella pecoris]
MPAPHPLHQRTFTTADASVVGVMFDQGAQVASWVAGGQDALWVSRQARFEEGVGIRGGVPVCLPWFGAGRSGQARPKHGIARTMPWSFVGEEVGEDSVTATYTLPAGSFPGRAFGLSVRYEVTFGPELEMRLSVENEGDQTASFEEALHTYLAADDVEAARIEGLDGVEYVDHVDGKKVKRQAGDVVFTGHTDRVYGRGGTVVLHGAAGGRSLEITCENSANIVVWNPWEGGTADMADFGDDEWRDMLCIEGANTLGEAIELAPGQAHVMGYRIRIL